MSGGAEASPVWYCPYCEMTVEPVSDSATMRAQWPGHHDFCPRCGNPVLSWPGDLPLPTEANVRMLRDERDAAVSTNHRLAKVAATALNMGELQGAEARYGRRQPFSNVRGWWN